MTLERYSPPIVVCDRCEGQARTLIACPCVRWGDRFLIDADEGHTVDGRAYRDCEQCRGSGYLTYDCPQCRSTGKRRAQLVLTVVNLDTGAVRSANVVPGGMEPRRNIGGRWELALSPVLDALAAEVDVFGYRDLYGMERPGEFNILLPAEWNPELPLPTRHRLESEAIARHCWHPWRIYHGRLNRIPTRKPATEVSRLCHLADLLCLDLVVEARCVDQGKLTWEIRYEVADSPVPKRQRRWIDDLRSAAQRTSFDDAIFGLRDRSTTAPAYYLRPHRPAYLEPQEVDLDLLERLIYANLRNHDGAAVGAQAVWHDGRWWVMALLPDDTVEVMTEQATGQVVRERITTLARAWELPAAEWQGDPIPYGPCPDCDPEHRLRPCLCTLGNQSPDPNCPGCSGAGATPHSIPCPTCRDSHRVYHGLVVTVTDLGGATMHVNWLHSDKPTDAQQVANHPGGKPVYQLPDCYQLRRWAESIRARPADLNFLDGGHDVGQDLREGLVTVDHPGIDPLTRYLVDTGGGQPAGRVLVSSAPPAAPPLTELIRLTLGLHQTLVLTLEDHRFNEHDPIKIHGEGWGVELLAPDRPMPAEVHPYKSSPEAAAAYFLEYLENATYNAIPDDARQGISVPQTPQPPPNVEDPVPLVRRLASHFAGHPVSIRYHLAGCHLYVHEYGGVRHLASARTVPIALTALGLGLGRDQP